MDKIDLKIINHLQHGFPLCSYPYRQAATELEIDEAELIDRLQKLLNAGILTRFGPLYNAEKLGGSLSLCAMQIPLDKFQQVAEQINALTEVAHNYQRDHTFNMWFVLATETIGQKQQVLDKIKQQTGCPVYDMPKEKEFFVGFTLPLCDSSTEVGK